MHVELGDLTPEYRAFVCVEMAGTHDVSNLDWRRPNGWSTSEDQIQTVSQSVNRGCIDKKKLKKKMSKIKL